jgi:DNA-binding beta-propeller fold protein YncE
MRSPPLLLALCACSAYSSGKSSTDTTAFGSVGESEPDLGSTTSAPPEEETDRRLLPPAQTDVYVFVANPDRDTVTRVNVRTLDVDTTPVGSRPEIVATTSDYQTAVVFNDGDDSVTILDAATLSKQTVDVRENLNQMVLSPDGAWAVLWRDSLATDPDDPPPEGLQSFNEVSFVGVRDGAHYPMPVGFDPKMVRFVPDSSLAVVISDAEIATIDLTVTPLVPERIELAPSVLDPPAAEEVIVSDDGSFAWVRQFGASELLVVDLGDGTVESVPAGENPTDLDLSPDGQLAVAVARTSAELYLFDAHSPFAAPEIVPLPAEGQYGSLLFEPTGDRAILYTTASLLERFAVWDRQEASVIERSLVKPVDSMAVTPTGGSLLVFHTVEDGPETEPVFAGQPALTLVDLSDFRSNPLLLPAEPTGYATSTTGRLGYFIMEDAPFLEVLDFVTLLPTELELASLPVFLGVLPDLDLSDADEPPAWVSQEHELGRISFFDPDAPDKLETITGFELNSGIEEEP